VLVNFTKQNSVKEEIFKRKFTHWITFNHFRFTRNLIMICEFHNTSNITRFFNHSAVLNHGILYIWLFKIKLLNIDKLLKFLASVLDGCSRKIC